MPSDERMPPKPVSRRDVLARVCSDQSLPVTFCLAGKMTCPSGLSIESGKASVLIHIAERPRPCPTRLRERVGHGLRERVGHGLSEAAIG
jgi:hypothetical protein